MIRIAIVEDNERTRNQIEKFLLKFQLEFNVDMDVISFEDGKQIVENYRADFDILLMDIEMPQMDGMTAARKIRERDTDVIIIFITNMARYAIKGYEVNAMDFVLKPMNYMMFSMKMNNALKLIRHKNEKSIALQLKDGLLKIRTSDIYYIEVSGHYLYYHTTEGKYKVLGALKDIELDLYGYSFSRCNNCYLVNLRYVTGIIQNIVMVAGNELQMSRPKKKQFMQAVADYIGGV